MAKISKDFTAGVLHPRENIRPVTAATLGALNAETIIATDGCASVMIDLRGTFNLTVTVEGSVDGTNYTLIPVRRYNAAGVGRLATIAGTSADVWQGFCGGFAFVRARVSAYTSGSATCLLSASNAPYDLGLQAPTTEAVITATGAAAAAVTLTIPAPTAGLRNYITYLIIERHASALLTAGATPVIVTTTNLPGSLAFSIPADAAAAGTVHEKKREPSRPIASSATGAATTIVCPTTTATIWRVEAGYYVAP